MTDLTPAGWPRPTQPFANHPDAGRKFPTATETNHRDLLLAHLRSAVDVVRNAENLAGEIMGNPWNDWREHIAILAERVEKTYELIKFGSL